jgi:hypothetical protein
MTNSEKLMTRAYMQKGEGSRRLGNQHHAKEFPELEARSR